MAQMTERRLRNLAVPSLSPAIYGSNEIVFLSEPIMMVTSCLINKTWMHGTKAMIWNIPTRKTSIVSSMMINGISEKCSLKMVKKSSSLGGPTLKKMKSKHR